MKISNKPLKKPIPASKRPAARRKLEKINKNKEKINVQENFLKKSEVVKKYDFLRKDARIIRQNKIYLKKINIFFKTIKSDFQKITNTKLDDYLYDKYTQKYNTRIFNSNKMPLDTLFIIQLQSTLFSIKEKYESASAINKKKLILDAIKKTNKKVIDIWNNYSSYNPNL